MELPPRQRGDILLPPGECSDIRRRLRRLAAGAELTSVVACAFDHRTRMLPFILADTKMAPAGVRAVAAELIDAGLDRTRVVLQQWTPKFRPSESLLDGRPPDMLLVSSMQMHWQRAMEMIADAWRIDPARRPLIIAGGPKCIYEPWDVFNADPAVRGGADVAVTGESYVLLALLERLLTLRGRGESLRECFARARDERLLEDIPGLVYAHGAEDGLAEELIDTGVQRLVGDLDELAMPGPAYRVLERPGLHRALARQPLPAGAIHRTSPIASLVMTLGCKFACPYCPNPAYNQRQYRLKSGRRIADEIEQLNDEFRVQYYFGADDNFFNDEARTLDIVGELIRRAEAGRRAHRKSRISTEVTVHDTLKLAEHLPEVRRAGVRALWLGVEDMTGRLVNKGQSVDKTRQTFELLLRNGIVPMPMMMHHDAQPLWTPGRPVGLINQVRLLRRAGAMNLQALMITPSPGSKLFEGTFTSGMAIAAAGGRRVETHMTDGNHVVASHHRRPWVKQLNLLLAYAYFFNPGRLVWALVRPKGVIPLDDRWPNSKPWSRKKRWTKAIRAHLIDAGLQLYGMYGLVQTVRRTAGWMFRLMRGRLDRALTPPVSPIPMRRPDGGRAVHDLRPVDGTADETPLGR